MLNSGLRSATLMALLLCAASCGSSSSQPPNDTNLGFLDGWGEAVAPDAVFPDQKLPSDQLSTDQRFPSDELSTDRTDPGEIWAEVDFRDPVDLLADALWDSVQDIPDSVTQSDLPISEATGEDETTSDVVTDQTTQPPPLFDLQKIHDPSTAECTFENPHTVFKDGVLLDVWHVSYLSFEAQGGQLVPIRIQGFAAKPSIAEGPMPALIQAHGLGGYAEEDHATGLAALTGTFVLAYTGPGGGSEPLNSSEGTPSSAQNGYHMFDVLSDPRTTWFWGHTTAAMRGITCLTTRPEVDPNRIGMTGFSAGGVATLLVAAVDPRLKAGVPLSGTLAWDVAVQSPKAWQHQLLTLAGLTVVSPEWSTLMSMFIHPQALLSSTSASLFLVNGTSDEFFPLTAHMATYSVLPPQKRTSFAGNFDHGCYQLTGLESPEAIEQRASLRAKGAQRAWFHHHFNTDPTYAYMPQPPLLQVSDVMGATYFLAVVDPGGNKLSVDSVHVWWSGDSCWSFLSQELEAKGNGLYEALVYAPLPANSVYFVDVVYKAGSILSTRFSISSEPVLPQGMVPAIRAMDTCL